MRKPTVKNWHEPNQHCHGAFTHRVYDGPVALVVSLQSQVSRQDVELKVVQSERDALAAELEGMRAELNTAASLAEHHVSLNMTP